MSMNSEMHPALLLFFAIGYGDRNFWLLETADKYFSLEDRGKSNSHLSIQVTLNGHHRISEQASFLVVSQRWCVSVLYQPFG